MATSWVTRKPRVLFTLFGVLFLLAIYSMNSNSICILYIFPFTLTPMNWGNRGKDEKGQKKNKAPFVLGWASLVAQIVKNLPAMQETHIQCLAREDPLEKKMATKSSILTWKIPWTEETGGLKSMGSQRVGHDWVTSSFLLGWLTPLFPHPTAASLNQIQNKRGVLE